MSVRAKRHRQDPMLVSAQLGRGGRPGLAQIPQTYDSIITG